MTAGQCLFFSRLELTIFVQGRTIFRKLGPVFRKSGANQVCRRIWRVTQPLVLSSKYKITGMLAWGLH